MRLIHINGVLVDLPRVQQGTLGSYHALQFDTCSIRDRYYSCFCNSVTLVRASWLKRRRDTDVSRPMLMKPFEIRLDITSDRGRPT